MALATVDRLEDSLAGYHAYHAARADLLRRLGRTVDAAVAYDRAITRSENAAERAFLQRRRERLQ